MKFHVLQVLAFCLCLCLGQICSDEYTDLIRKEMQKDIRNKINGVGEQFIDDITIIVEKNPGNELVDEYLVSALVNSLGLISSRLQDSKIDVNNVKDFHSSNDHIKRDNAAEIAIQTNELKILKSIFSRQLPSERYNGIINLGYVLLYPDVTSEEIESALGYLYGTDTAATKTSFLDSHNFPEPIATDCPIPTRKYSMAIDKLKTIIDIRSKVIQDFNAIREKFPCERFVHEFLQSFKWLISKLQADKTKITPCMLKEYSKIESSYSTKEDFEKWMKPIESILSTRLPDETFRGLFNIGKVNFPDTTNDEIEKALEYLYDDVPKTNCSVAESSKLESE